MCRTALRSLGRRNLIIIAAILFTIGAIGAALAPSVAVLVLFWMVLGLAVGTAALIVPLYLSEIALLSLNSRQF
jgi:MFS transporter, SP family, major inositol transporter